MVRKDIRTKIKKYTLICVAISAAISSLQIVIIPSIYARLKSFSKGRSEILRKIESTDSFKRFCNLKATSKLTSKSKLFKSFCIKGFIYVEEP